MPNPILFIQSNSQFRQFGYPWVLAGFYTNSHSLKHMPEYFWLKGAPIRALNLIGTKRACSPCGAHLLHISKSFFTMAQPNSGLPFTNLFFFKRVQLPEKKEFRIAEAELYDVPAFFSIHFPSILFIKRPGQSIRFVRA